ncbi:HugZ family protein [Pseudooceanicola sp. MF1-13]|uniref:HugZ family pyridoxamine 5'-phosphate oxidase n=1 Tax=Pseudooceanicola sp. MF1-13 TaxID=3379095 RepID=UPI00389218A9
MSTPIRPTDDDARQMARDLLAGAEHAALAVLDPESGAPSLSRIALALAPDGCPISLVSSLSAHSTAMAQDGRCSLLVGDPGSKGDPLTHPRLTVQAQAKAIPRDAPEFPALRDHYAAQRPKSKLYIDFGDFYLVRFDVQAAFLNGGFGKAFRLTPADLGL